MEHVPIMAIMVFIHIMIIMALHQHEVFLSMSAAVQEIRKDCDIETENAFQTWNYCSVQNNNTKSYQTIV